jgi:hypothetical protein
MSETSDIKQIPSALHGYVAVDLAPPPGYGFGVSFYVTVWALLERPLKDFQVGLPSTWIQPENSDFKLPLCPIGTASRDDADKQEAYKKEHPEDKNAPHDWIDQAVDCFRAVFQNIEGGVGFWGNTFPTNAPKYRINGVPDCYNTPIGSPGWPFGDTNVLADKDMGLAQLSNRIIIPPDGIPFAAGSETKRLGVAWMVLPLTDYDGYFLLQTKKSAGEAKSCLQRASSGGILESLDKKVGSNDNQLWTLVASEQKKGYFYLKTKGNGTPADFGGDTLWKLVLAAEDYYYLETDKGKRLEGSVIVKTAARSNSDMQLWKLVPQAVNHNPPSIDEKDIDPAKVEVATGDFSWTLFLNAANFKGPVAFFPPKTWSRISKRNPPAVGRGLDARTAVMASPAMEFNTVPGLQISYGGKTYLRIPKLLFPTEKHGSDLVTPLMQDIKLYSREAIYAPVMSWFANGSAASGAFADKGTIANNFQSAAPIGFDQEGNTLRRISDLVEVVNLGDKNNKSCSWGLRWKEPPSGSGFLKGQFPEYFVDGVAVPASSIPPATGLAAATFAPPSAARGYYSAPLGSPTRPRDQWPVNVWTRPGPEQAIISYFLGDGTQVTFTWYKFIDQPALQNLNLTPEQKSQLQSRVELLHKKWTIKNNFMKPPTAGTLVSLDLGVIVTPPKGKEVGYVPIVTFQKPR